jgi:acetyltransferase AlgX (SGNH hydrolase-like protein)
MAPLILLLGLSVDIGSRFASYDLVGFRAWEAMTRGTGMEGNGPFVPNGRYVNAHAYGDLAALGNRPDLRQYRREVFTTDEFGFRNPTDSVHQRYDVAIGGTSYAAGSSVSDDETLSARLATELSRPVYNAGGLPIDRWRYVPVVERLGLRNGLLILEYMESAPAPGSVPVPHGKAEEVKRRLAAFCGPRYSDVRGWLAQSPFQLLLFKLFKRLENDCVLPNVFSRRVVPGQLINGDPILFQAEQVNAHPSRAAVAASVAELTAMSAALAGRGTKLLVVLVPSQFHVYGPLVATPVASASDRTYLDEIGHGLSTAGVLFVDLSEPLENAARNGLRDHTYVYWRDDTHWNARGIALAAHVIAARVRQLGF